MTFATHCTRVTPSRTVKGRDLEAEFIKHFKIDGELPYLVAIGIRRLAVCDPDGDFDTDMVMWAFGVLTDRPAIAVLWAYGLSKGRSKVNGQAITLEHWAMQLHPEGPPTQEAFFKLWDAQKGSVLGLPCDNYLDSTEAWK